MVLSNRLDNKMPRSLLQRTILYVLGFGTGALVIAAVLSFAFVSLAEGAFPSKGRPSSAAGSPELKAGQPVRVINGPSKKGISRKRPARGNEATGASKDKSATSL